MSNIETFQFEPQRIEINCNAKMTRRNEDEEDQTDEEAAAVCAGNVKPKHWSKELQFVTRTADS